MKKIVLVGGCFDVLHPGHLIFLEKAKKEGDELVVLLESDEKIKRLKGKNRPINTQDKRAKALLKTDFVDSVVSLPDLKTDQEYDEIILKIKPTVIALTKGVEDKNHKRAAKLVKAKLIYVTDMIGDYSSTKFIVQTQYRNR